MNKPILVVGLGAWGQALADVARAAGHGVETWGRGMAIPQAKYSAAIIAVPAQAVRSVLQHLKSVDCHVIILAAKGIEQGSGQFMHEVAQGVHAGEPCMIISGPSFASDVRKGLPTAVTLAAADLVLAQTWAAALSRPRFRIYASDDLLGVAIGGALKNVLAIACGISDGKGFGDSARAALTARSFAELLRFGQVLGVRSETLMGLSGLGDLLLTCASPQSRNYAFGFRIGQGQPIALAWQVAAGVVEGALTAEVAYALALKHGIEMPIVAAVVGIIHKGVDPDLAIAALLDRPVGREV